MMTHKWTLYFLFLSSDYQQGFGALLCNGGLSDPDKLRQPSV